MPWPPILSGPSKRALQARASVRLAATGGTVVPATKKPHATPEWDFQEALVKRLEWLTIAPATFWFVPNGGNLSRAQRGRFKAMGLRPGVHDLHFIWRDDIGIEGTPTWWGRDSQDNDNGARYATLELKAGKNTTEVEQDNFGARMLECGHRWAQAHADRDGVEGALAILRTWGFPMRAYR